MFLKQSTAVDVSVGPFVDATDGDTAETGLTLTQPDVRLKKNGANWAQKSAAQTLAHEEDGYYEVNLSTTDTNTVGLLRLSVHETGARGVNELFFVLPALAYNFLTSGVLGPDSIVGDTFSLDGQAVIGDNIASFTLDGLTADHVTAGTIGKAILDSATNSTSASTALTSLATAVAALPTLAEMLAANADLAGTSPGGGDDDELVLADDVTDNQCNDWLAVLVSGPGSIEAQVVVDTVGATNTLTFAANWSTTPTSATQYIVLQIAAS